MGGSSTTGRRVSGHDAERQCCTWWEDYGRRAPGRVPQTEQHGGDQIDQAYGWDASVVEPVKTNPDPTPWAYMNTLDGEGGEGWLTEGIATENFPPRGVRVSGYLIGWHGGGSTPW